MSSHISELRTGRSHNMREAAYYKEILTTMGDRVVESASASSALAAYEIWKDVHATAIEIFKEIENQTQALEQDVFCNKALTNYMVRENTGSSMIQYIKTHILLLQDRLKELEKVKAEFNELIEYLKNALKPIDDPD